MVVKRARRSKPFTRRVRRKTTTTRFRRKPIGKSQLVCRRYYEAAAVAGLDATPQGGLAYTFTLNTLNNFAEFTALFDTYKIIGIAHRWVLKTNPDVTATAFKGQNVRVLFAYDYNDNTVPSTDNELKEYSNSREVWLSSANPASRWFFFRPKTEVANVGQWRMWIDSSNPGQAHYGIKAYWTNMYSGVYLVSEFRYYLAFKQVK